MDFHCVCIKILNIHINFFFFFKRGGNGDSRPHKRMLYTIIAQDNKCRCIDAHHSSHLIYIHSVPLEIDGKIVPDLLRQH